MKLVVHRATDQIGGNCIEIVASSGDRVILDIGRPLDAPRDARDLLPRSLDLESPARGILISHPHQDHYGLLDDAPAAWPGYSGPWARKLIHLTQSIFGRPVSREWHEWQGGVPMQVGPFRVTPLLTDHSAFDAYMLLIEVEGRRILYSGDFRMHGRKSQLVHRLMSSPPRNVDVLLMEGTNIGTTKPTAAEKDLEESFRELFKRTPGRVFVGWSAQNIDRTVTLYRACLRSSRTLVVDLYTAEVMDLLAEAGRLPQPGWEQLKVVVTPAFARLYRSKGREDFVRRMARHGISAARLAGDENRWVVMVRPSLLRDFERKGVHPTSDDAWSFSQWHGYLRERDGSRLKSWFEAAGAKAAHIHTSGHASTADLHAFARAIGPKMLVPIHGVAWDDGAHGFDDVVRLLDGEPLEI